VVLIVIAVVISIILYFQDPEKNPLNPIKKPVRLTFYEEVWLTGGKFIRMGENAQGQQIVICVENGKQHEYLLKNVRKKGGGNSDLTLDEDVEVSQKCSTVTADTFDELYLFMLFYHIMKNFDNPPFGSTTVKDIEKRMNEIYKRLRDNHLSMDSSMEDLQLSLCRIHEFKEFFKQTLLGQQIENFRTYFAILAKDDEKVQPWKRFISYFYHNVQQPKLTLFYNHDDVDIVRSGEVLTIQIPSSHIGISTGPHSSQSQQSLSPKTI
jgi:hypothetical protein